MEKINNSAKCTNIILSKNDTNLVNNRQTGGKTRTFYKLIRKSWVDSHSGIQVIVWNWLSDDTLDNVKQQSSSIYNGLLICFLHFINRTIKCRPSIKFVQCFFFLFPFHGIFYDLFMSFLEVTRQVVLIVSAAVCKIMLYIFYT